MVGMKRMLCCSLFSLAISVAVTAAPIDMTHFDVTVPQTITSEAKDLTETEMTFADFVAAEPYTMVIETIDKVPLDETGNLRVTVNLAFAVDKVAVKQNSNFERMQS